MYFSYIILLFIIIKWNIGIKAYKIYQNMILRKSPAISELDIYVGNSHTKIDLMPTGILWIKTDLGKTKAFWHIERLLNAF